MSAYIVTKTPLRVSFNGGGTDMRYYYERETGLALSTTIDKYIYVTVKEHGDLFDEKIRLNYSETEVLSNFDDIKNNIIRECLRFLNISNSLYISTIADLPAMSGLGSSSSFTVGLLNALNVFMGNSLSLEQIAEQASYIEIDVLNAPIGKQDHYAAAMGGFNLFNFQKSGKVIVENLNYKDNLQKVFNNSMFFWTGKTRSATSVLINQKQNFKKNIENLHLIKNLTIESVELFKDNFDINKFGKILDNSWAIKRKLSDKISNNEFDILYEKAKKVGAIGGKILGAGGGGFFMIIAEKRYHEAVKKIYGKYNQIKINPIEYGTKLIYSND